MKFVVILLTVFLVWCMSIVESRRYKLHDHIALVANTVGPFNNPTETYPVSLMSFFFYQTDFFNSKLPHSPYENIFLSYPYSTLIHVTSS